MKITFLIILGEQNYYLVHKNKFLMTNFSQNLMNVFFGSIAKTGNPRSRSQDSFRSLGTDFIREATHQSINQLLPA